ncbi:YafY family protein [Actinocorallia longicatena]|uniref:YafY family protein n=1 Tax=Actinocorallia longicatena TaxID=111803 RepID=A0ABP6QML3_9ACTN
MVGTSARLLRLLALLQSRRDWPGAELCERLGVAPRTVRRDVGRLRELGYPVDATPGVAGGYRLGVGAVLPPLLLDDDEAVAVAVGLRGAGTIEGIEETALRALTKLERMLPSRLRHRISALHAYTVTVPGPGPTVDADVLITLSAACRDGLRLRFDYADRDGAFSTRDVEPHRIVSWGRRWYLVAWDLAPGDWRIFRADRVRPRVPAGPRFTPREPPEGDFQRFVAGRLAFWPIEARVRVHAPAERIAGLTTAEVIISDDTGCEVALRGDSLSGLAVVLGFLGAEFDVLSPPELRTYVAELGRRYTRAAGSSRSGEFPEM